MQILLKKTIIFLRYPVDLIISLVIFFPALLLLFFRRMGSRRLRMTSAVLKKIGVWPIRNHYYEPLFRSDDLSKPLNEPRILPGIDMNVEYQLNFLKTLNKNDEFIDFVKNEKLSSDADKFVLNNNSFGTGDSDFLFQFIRNTKPSKVIEIGSGNSTKVAHHALNLNKEIDGIDGKHICFEPYEMPWLDKYPGIQLIRERVEDSLFSWSDELEEGDLLFIDSTHMIRPQGDVLYEYLNIIPQLKSGVNVHVHDIFTPRDYLTQWIEEDVLFWNEQYLCEALMCDKSRYKILASLNYLKHSHYDSLISVCPFITKDREPGSFYFQIK
jgi:hypothetical protein